jgi:hypothetical protein
MIDANRAEPRFPPNREEAVRARIAEQMDTWGVGPQDVAICGGACGADILFAEQCTARGADVLLMLPLHEPAFLERSVRVGGNGWEGRYFHLRDDPRVTIVEPRDGDNDSEFAFERNNLRIVDHARSLVDDPSRVLVLLVWDERPASDGPGGTAGFANLVKARGWSVAIINPKD